MPKQKEQISLKSIEEIDKITEHIELQKMAMQQLRQETNDTVIALKNLNQQLEKTGEAMVKFEQMHNDKSQ